MAQIKTNSNSITGILILALNQESIFRTKILNLFESKISKKLTSNLIFYECTHTPLLYKEMNGKEIDIIARSPGKHKPDLMIEVKANIGEPLQESQKKGGEYQKTSSTHDIPLIYIIPKQYSHRGELPKNAKIIEWEEILQCSENTSISFDAQINQFVELSFADEIITEGEKELFEDKDLLLEIYKFKKEILKSIYEILKKNHRKIDNYEEDQYGVGFSYHFKGENYFIGFNPYNVDEKERYFFALDIAESCKNTELEKENQLYFEDGYYYLPILNEKTACGDTKVVDDFRKKLSDLNLIEISKEIRNNFSLFYSLRTKIGDYDFDSLFENDLIDNKKYQKIENKLQ